MLILGIDPGYAIVGFGLVESIQGKYRLAACGAINTPAGVRLPARLWRISTDLEHLIGQFHPDVMAIEELFFNHNVTTGIGVAQARGVILMTAEKLGLPICEYNPSQVKQAVVGYGKAEKRQVMDMTKRLLNLNAVPKPDDAADAVAIALCHARSATSLLKTIFGEIIVFYYLNGTVTRVEPYLAVIDCGGVGYACRTTNYTVSKLSVGKAAKLYTHLYVREEIFELYGFSSESELGCFRMLIGVSGVGPKAALAILSSNSPEGLAMAIVSDNEKALTSAPGIGKKIAQRIILELKDKLAKGQLTMGGGETFAGGVTIIPENKASEASAALAVLGYSQSEIAMALKGIDLDGMSLESVIKQALKKMVKA